MTAKAYRMSIAELEAQQRARRKFHNWRREFNDAHREAFVGLVADRAGVHLGIAWLVVCELRGAANKARPRGFISDWDIAEGAYACKISEADATRVVEALYDIGWLQQEAIVNWTATQPEDEDPTSKERQQRSRARKKARRDLARRAALGEIGEAERRAEELRILGDAGRYPPSRVTDRDTVTVTPDSDSDTDKKQEGGLGVFEPAKFGAPEYRPAVHSNSGESGDDAAAAELWLAVTGKRIVVERMEITLTLAATRIERWCTELGGDAAALVAVIKAADATDYIGARFHNLVVDGIKRRPREAGPQRELLLPPVIATGRKAG